jgi:hypothetical protein
LFLQSNFFGHPSIFVIDGILDESDASDDKVFKTGEFLIDLVFADHNVQK